MENVSIIITTNKDSIYNCKSSYYKEINKGYCECYDMDSDESIFKIECLEYPNKNIEIINNFRDFHSLSEVIKWKIS